MKKKKDATKEQIGGNHYKSFKIQPYYFCMENKLNMLQSNIIKYVCRYKDKGGIQDLEKAKHCLDLLIDYNKNNE